MLGVQGAFYCSLISSQHAENSVEQLPFAILTLMFISAALSAIFFVAWRTFGRMPHARTWAIMYLLSAGQWGMNIAYALNLVPNLYLHQSLLALLGPATTFMGVAGFLQRAQRKVSLPLMIGLVLLTWGGSLWFLFVQPHEGLRASLLPFVIVACSLWVMWILFDEPRPKRTVEWAMIGCQGLFAVSMMVIGSIALSQGAIPNSEIEALYVSVSFLTLPTFFALLGMFALSLIASDISTRAEVLAEYQKQKRQEEAELSWGTIQDAIEAIPDLIAIDDGDGTFVTCNTALAKFLGKEKEELLGRRSLDIIDLYRKKFESIDGVKVQSGDDIPQALWRALTTGCRLDVITSDNRNFIVDCGYLRAGGQILVARDVTQLYRARTRLETAIQSMPIGFALFDRERQLVACNKFYENMLQKDYDWISKQSVSSLVSTFQRRIKATKNASLVERSEWLHDWVEAVEQPTKRSATVLMEDDTWLDVAIRPVPGEGFVTIANDVTNRRLLEIDIENSEAQLRQILAGQPFPVMLVRVDDDTILFASEAAIDALGGSEQNVVGQSAGKFLGDQHRPMRLDLRDEEMARGGVQEAVLKRPSGESVPILYSAQEIVYAGQKAQVISFIDISNIKELQSELARQREALFQSEKLNALGTLLAGVAHELNNPLTVVVANAHVLSLTSDNPDVKSRIEKITDAADRCTRIIRSFLDMARKSPGEKVEFDPVSCVRQAIDLSLYGFQGDNVQIRENIPDDLPAMKGDPDQLAQVVLNLLINARQALHEEDAPRIIEVSMGLDKSGKKIELHVTDNGSGVPADIRDNIFDPFFTTKKVGHGTGMGLSIVRGIVKSHGGSINLLQNGTKGAHFRVTLPHVGYRLSQMDAFLAEPPEEPRQHILIVDDEPDVLAALEDILILQGHDVLAVGSGNEALKALGKSHFDGVLSDIRMPEMDGEELFSAIQENYPDMVGQVAFITGNDLSEQTQAFLDSCQRPHLGKPFVPDDIAILLQKLSNAGQQQH